MVTVEQSGNCTIVLCKHLLDCAIVSSSCSTVVNAEEARVDCELCLISVHLATWTSSYDDSDSVQWFELACINTQKNTSDDTPCNAHGSPDR